MQIGLELELLTQTLGVCRMDPQEEIPHWAVKSPFFSVSKSSDELSIVCNQDEIPIEMKAERGWRCFKVKGTLDFSLTGILASLAVPLAEAKVSLFAVSTFDTDYLLVKENDLTKAFHALKLAGHRIENEAERHES